MNEWIIKINYDIKKIRWLEVYRLIYTLLII